MRIFLTGGTGFIGSHVVKHLSDLDYIVTVLARDPGKVSALHDLKGVTLIHGEINDANIIGTNLEGSDALIHIALHWGDSPVDMLLNDTHSSVQLFDLAARAGVKNILYTSSTAANDWVYMNNDPEKNPVKKVTEATRLKSATYYGATKGASELYLTAIAFQNKIRANTVRPGYTYGNPAVPDGDIEPDDRFRTIVKKALNNEPIEVIKNDGTQFIDACDLAKIYSRVLDSDLKNRVYFGLGTKFITWEQIAGEAIRLCNSSSKLIIKDPGWPDEPVLFDVSAIEEDFGLAFDGWHGIPDHLNYLIGIHG
ncbi:MAG: NAD(P)-dependent oxidoreductase [Bacteroidales bacterium]